MHCHGKTGLLCHISSAPCTSTQKPPSKAYMAVRYFGVAASISLNVHTPLALLSSTAATAAEATVEASTGLSTPGMPRRLATANAATGGSAASFAGLQMRLGRRHVALSLPAQA